MSQNEINEEQFKTTLMGGFDKDDVLNQFKNLKETAEAEKSKLNLEIDEKNKIIAEKEDIIREKAAEIEKLNKDISVKYQSYIDNYDTIGKIVYETRIESEKTVAEANAKKESIIAEAEKAADEKIAKAKSEVEKTMAEGKRRYGALQEEINELIILVNQVQHKFMKSFKAIHEISDTINEDLYGDLDFDDDEDEIEGEN